MLSTKLALAYAAGLATVYRAHHSLEHGCAVDLACGPGHYTLSLGSHLGLSQVVGIDLSAPMIEIAATNAGKAGLEENVRFELGDATDLSRFERSSIDLGSFTDAAHHIPNLETVERVFREMDRITKPEGLVMVMDLVRLRTAKLTEKYVNTLGRDYVERGLPHFFEDFRNSMYAAWTVRELRSAIPRDSRRWWCHLVPRGLPTLQIILGLPIGRKKVFVRSGFPWPRGQPPIPPDCRWEWRMLWWSLKLGSRKMIPPGK